MVQSYSRTWIVLDYWLNTGYYAAHCVNKSRPELRCNGKCIMMKKILAEEQKDAENQQRLSEKFDTGPLSSQHFFADLGALTFRVANNPHTMHVIARPSNGHVPGLLRPPAA
jgi:hypothetical protein